jgi:hypothetical protein
MSHAQNVFSITTRTQALVAHPLIKRANLGFTLEQPFSWSLINAASVLARMPQESSPEFDPVRVDQMKIKCANLRHFNRQVGSNDVGMHAIAQCLRTEEEIPLDAIKQQARDRVKIERRSGKCSAANVSARYTFLVSSMYEAAQAKHREIKLLLDEVYYICNRSDEQLSSHEASGIIHTGDTFEDHELVDYDAYDYVIESLLDRCTMPIVKATEEVQRVMDKTYRVSALSTAQLLMTELKKLGEEVGISWAKLDAETAAINAELDAVQGAEAQSDAEIDALCDDSWLPAAETAQTKSQPQRTTIKSPERLAREAEEARITSVDAALKEATAAKKARAAAKKAAKSSELASQA